MPPAPRAHAAQPPPNSGAFRQFEDAERRILARLADLSGGSSGSTSGAAEAQLAAYGGVRSGGVFAELHRSLIPSAVELAGRGDAEGADEGVEERPVAMEPEALKLMETYADTLIEQALFEARELARRPGAKGQAKQPPQQ